MDKNKLIQLDIDYETGLSRFCGNEALYEKFIAKFIADHTFDNLLSSMEAEDYHKAFKAAHTMKGIAGNLSFIDLYNQLCPFVNALREDSNIDEAIELFPSIKESYYKLVDGIKAEI